MFRTRTLTAAAAALLLAAPLAAQQHHAAMRSPTIVQVAREAGSFSTLLAAVEAAGLTETLMGDGPFTVFAPTNEAFAKLPKGTIETLLRPENREQLKAILTYHVVPGRISAEEAIMAKKARTVEGNSLRVGITDGALRVNSTKIITADVRASNGVIHVIDEVLLPPAARPSHH